jgi:hypothetical protein
VLVAVALALVATRSKASGTPAALLGSMPQGVKDAGATGFDFLVQLGVWALIIGLLSAVFRCVG